jgi:hypothetical protein
MNSRLALFIVLVSAGCATRPIQSAPPRAPSALHAGHNNLSEDEKIDATCEAAGWTSKPDPNQQKIINELFGTRAHRMQHALWHAVRSGLTPQDTQSVITAFGSQWKEGHPLCPPPQNNADDVSYNPTGEDFLYMHHEMVMMLRFQLTAKGQKCITPWTTIPEAKEWPIKGELKGPKTDNALKLLKGWDAFIQNEKWMSQVSLSQLGWALEFTLHNNLHMRYADDRPAPKFRATKPEDDGAPMPKDGVFPAGWNFDDVAYNWLADPYGAALNPVFWKIHGYVDHALALWLKAHGYARVALDCQGDTKTCYQWRGQWVGNLPDIPAADDQPDSVRMASPKGGSRTDSKAFTRQRLAHQRLGVIEDEPNDGRLHAPAPVPGGGSKSPAPDLLEVARQRLCP